MAVGYEQVDPPIVIIIEEFRSPADVGQAYRRDLSRIRNIGERVLSVVPVERVVIVVEICDKQVQLLVMIVVPYSHAHASLLAAVLVSGSARCEANLLERAVA